MLSKEIEIAHKPKQVLDSGIKQQFRKIYEQLEFERSLVFDEVDKRHKLEKKQLGESCWGKIDPDYYFDKHRHEKNALSKEVYVYKAIGSIY